MSEATQRKIAIFETDVDDATLTLTKTQFGHHVLNGELQYTVPLPELLNFSDSWQVRRYAKDPSKIRCRYGPPYEDIKTLYDLFESSVVEHSQAPYLGTRKVIDRDNGKFGPYAWMTYSQAAEARTEIGSGMLHFGIKPGAKTGICSVNCKDWVLVDLACHAYSMVTVPLYDTLGADAVSYILGHAEVAALACSAQVLDRILNILPQRPDIKLLVVYGWPAEQKLPEAPKESAVRLVTLEELQRVGRENPRPHHPPKPDDLALLCFTSGTTGVPKGLSSLLTMLQE